MQVDGAETHQLHTPCSENTPPLSLGDVLAAHHVMPVWGYFLHDAVQPEGLDGIQ